MTDHVYILPADICRCHDDHCPQRVRCQRWTQRHVSRNPDHTVHSESLWQPVGPTGQGTCLHFILDTNIEE